MYILNQSSKTPLHIQLYTQLKQDIIDNFTVGEKLPSIRKMASNYNLSKTTIESAYSQLVAEGYIESFPQSGYKVIETQSQPFIQKSLQTKPQEEIKYKYDFAPVNLSSDIFPLKIWKRLFAKYINDSMYFGMYTKGQGEYELRVQIAKYLSLSRGVHCEAEQVIIGSGFSNSMELLARILKSSHHTFAMETPGYHLAQRIFTAHEYKVFPIDVTQNGLNIQTLNTAQTKLVYVTPSHQYPTGVTMPIKQRQQLLQWAQDNKGFIIEDDYDSELNYIHRPIPSLQGLDQFERVIYVGTFSKALSATLRISYLVLPKPLLKEYEKDYSSKFSSVPLMMQKTLCEFMKEGHWERHLKKVRTHNRKKHNLMKQHLESKLGNSMKIVSQGGGLNINIQPTQDINYEKLKELALKEKVKIYFAKDVCDNKWNAIRLGFGGFQEKEIESAIDLFAKIWFQALEKN